MQLHMEQKRLYEYQLAGVPPPASDAASTFHAICCDEFIKCYGHSIENTAFPCTICADNHIDIRLEPYGK